MYDAMRERVYLIHYKRRFVLLRNSGRNAFVTNNRIIAQENCRQAKRQVILTKDILSAMRSLGFENYELVLETYMRKYGEVRMIL